jgi:hypothetical protein
MEYGNDLAITSAEKCIRSLVNPDFREATGACQL